MTWEPEAADSQEKIAERKYHDAVERLAKTALVVCTDLIAAVRQLLLRAEVTALDQPKKFAAVTRSATGAIRKLEQSRQEIAAQQARCRSLIGQRDVPQRPIYTLADQFPHMGCWGSCIYEART